MSHNDPSGIRSRRSSPSAATGSNISSSPDETGCDRIAERLLRSNRRGEQPAEIIDHLTIEMTSVGGSSGSSAGRGS